jgi:lysophospholipase L1-like esterase
MNARVWCPQIFGRTATRIAGVAIVAATLAIASASMAPTRASAVPASAQLYVAGDSIAAGTGIRFDFQRFDSRVADRTFGPDHSRMHVVAHPGQCLVATICAGQPLVATWDSEVLGATPAPTTVIVQAGRNDLVHVTDQQILDAYAQLVTAAEARGIRVLVCTIVPSATTYVWAPWTEPQRRRVNDQIRQRFAPNIVDWAAPLGDAIDGVYDSGDHIHPSWIAVVPGADMVPIGRIQ